MCRQVNIDSTISASLRLPLDEIVTRRTRRRKATAHSSCFWCTINSGNCVIHTVLYIHTRCTVNVTQTIALYNAARELFNDSVEVRDSAASGEKNVECSHEKKKKKKHKNYLSRMKLQFKFQSLILCAFMIFFVRARYETLHISFRTCPLFSCQTFFLFLLKKWSFEKINECRFIQKCILFLKLIFKFI